EKRRGDELYINDGAYGALFDAAHVGWRFPVALLREEASVRGNAVALGDRLARLERLPRGEARRPAARAALSQSQHRPVKHLPGPSKR
ncbi:MAG: hypothetical protein RLZZ253_2242, partial [Verrucomicrobiota bacterium]